MRASEKTEADETVTWDSSRRQILNKNPILIIAVKDMINGPLKRHKETSIIKSIRLFFSKKLSRPFNLGTN